LVQIDVFANLKTAWRIHLPADVKAAQSTMGQQGLDLIGQAQMGVGHGQVMPKQQTQRAKL
jgi:hypothetical protein